MNDHQPIEKFLETASAGLAGDRELQLDVQAELRSHLDERLRDAEETGLSGAAAEAKALATMGEPIELADKLATANRPRMRLRAWLRHTLRWALVPLAVVIAVLCAQQPIQNGRWLFGSSEQVRYQPPRLPATVTPEQRRLFDALAIYNFPFSKRVESSLAKSRLLWETSPTNQVYLHNYLSRLVLYRHQLSKKEDRSRYLANVQDIITTLKPYDPGNARFDYLLAWIDMDLACQLKLTPKEIPPQDARTKPFDDSTRPDAGFNGVLVIHDRARLDRAMGHLREALQKPALRMHDGELELACLKILGKPTSIVESFQQIALVNDVWMLDLALLRQLGQEAPFYGELLIKEGHPEEAEILLNAWKRIIHHLAFSDSKGLLETIIAINISHTGRENSNIYERLGDEAKAVQARAEYKLLIEKTSQRVNFKNSAWKKRNQDLLALQAQCGPRAFEWFDVEFSDIDSADFDATARQCSRRQEYLLADSLMASLISSLALMSMLGCLAVTLWYRFKRKSMPLLLLPNLAETLWVMAGGVLLPLLAYHTLVRLLPYAGREYSLFYAWPKYLAALVFLLVAIGWLTVALSSHFLRCRCRQLGIPASSKAHWGWLGTAGLLLLVQVGFFLVPDPGVLTRFAPDPSRWPLLPAAILLLLVTAKILFTVPIPPRQHWGWLVAAAMIIGPVSLFYVDHVACNAEQLLLALSMLLGLLALLWLFFVFRHWRQPTESRPLHQGTLARSLIPVLAFTMLFLNVASTPVYRFEERQLVEQTNAIMISPDNHQPVFKNHAAEKLRAELQAALEKIGK